MRGSLSRKRRLPPRSKAHGIRVRGMGGGGGLSKPPPRTGTLARPAAAAAAAAAATAVAGSGRPSAHMRVEPDVSSDTTRLPAARARRWKRQRNVPKGMARPPAGNCPPQLQRRRPRRPLRLARSIAAAADSPPRRLRLSRAR